MLHFHLMTSNGTQFNRPITKVLIPGELGLFEVLKDHAALIALVKTGQLLIIDQNHKAWVWQISKGIVEIYQNQITLLTDTAELSQENNN